MVLKRIVTGYHVNIQIFNMIHRGGGASLP